MNNTDIDKLLDDNKLLCNKICMNDRLEVNGVLRKLIHVLNNNINGDVVELGCNSGGTSFWIQTILKNIIAINNFMYMIAGKVFLKNMIMIILKIL